MDVPPDSAKVEAFIAKFPGTRAVRAEADILDDAEIRLVATAMTSDRAQVGMRVMNAGKD